MQIKGLLSLDDKYNEEEKNSKFMIYISTGGFNNKSFDEAIDYLNKFGINSFELSGGLYKDDLLDTLTKKNLSNQLVMHNYFPPHKSPFVFNLASLNKKIAEQSINHALNAIDHSSEIDSRVYSFHAGYLIDPNVDELGKKINKRVINDRDKAMEIFIKRVNEISVYANKKNVKIMIENNVLSHKNYEEFKDNPLLMIDSTETKEVLDNTHDNVGLLVDVAHLKVSANTLNFSAIDYLKQFFNDIQGYHLSDNDGRADTNSPITKKSWFWPYINKNVDYFSLEIYQNNGDILKSQYNLAKTMLIK